MLLQGSSQQKPRFCRTCRRSIRRERCFTKNLTGERAAAVLSPVEFLPSSQHGTHFVLGQRTAINRHAPQSACVASYADFTSLQADRLNALVNQPIAICRQHFPVINQRHDEPFQRFKPTVAMRPGGMPCPTIRSV